MNDATPVREAKANGKAKNKLTEKGMRVFERIESGFDQLADVWAEALNLGMVSKCEHDQFVNDTMALRYATLSLHCRGTAVAQRNDCDVIQTRGGPGR